MEPYQIYISIVIGGIFVGIPLGIVCQKLAIGKHKKRIIRESLKVGDEGNKLIIDGREFKINDLDIYYDGKKKNIREEIHEQLGDTKKEEPKVKESFLSRFNIFKRKKKEEVSVPETLVDSVPEEELIIEDVEVVEVDEPILPTKKDWHVNAKDLIKKTYKESEGGTNNKNESEIL